MVLCARSCDQVGVEHGWSVPAKERFPASCNSRSLEEESDEMWAPSVFTRIYVYESEKRAESLVRTRLSKRNAGDNEATSFFVPGTDIAYR